MKKSEFKQLIREEIRKVLNEATSKRYSTAELLQLAKATPYNKDGSPRFSLKNLIDIYNSAYKPFDGLYRDIPVEDKKAHKAIYKILVDIGYYKPDPRGYSLDYNGDLNMPDKTADVTKNPDVYVTTDGKNLKDFDAMLYRQTFKSAKPNVIPTKTPMSGKQYTDGQIAKFISDDDAEEWFTMFVDDEQSGGYWHPEDSVLMANDWLKEKGYKFRVKKAVSKDDGQNITWTIK
jgi:hypothetical protein